MNTPFEVIQKLLLSKEAEYIGISEGKKRVKNKPTLNNNKL